MASLAIPDSPNKPLAIGADRWLAIGLALLFALPILLPPVLPFADLGGHLGRYAIQLDGGRDPQLAQWYTFRWLLIPNLGVDLLVQLIGPLIGLEPAIRLIVFVTALLQAFGLLTISRVVHGRITPFAVMALPFIYAHSMLYGFLNYMLSLGLLWCSLALWIALSRPGGARLRWVVFALIAVAMWTCHLVGWALLCIGAGSQELIRQSESKSSLVRGAVASVAPLSCLLAPWLLKLLMFQPATGTGKSSGWFLLTDKLIELSMVFRDKWQALDMASAAIVVLIIVWVGLSSWTRLNRGLTLAAAITALCVILVPDRLLGSFFADQRLIEPALIFGLLAPDLSGRGPAKLAPILLAVATVFAGTRLTASTISLWQFGNRSAEDLRVLGAIPAHAQMVTFRAMRCPPPMEWTIDRWTHLAGYAVARRHAFSNDQWDVPGAQLLHVHNPATGPYQVDDSQIDFERRCGTHAGVPAKVRRVPATIPYLWVIWSTGDVPLSGWTPIAQQGRSIVYRRAPG